MYFIVVADTINMSVRNQYVISAHCVCIGNSSFLVRDEVCSMNIYYYLDGLLNKLFLFFSRLQSNVVIN